MKNNGKALFIVGTIMAVVGIIWGWLGFYMSQAPILLFLVVGGGVLAFVGSRINRGKEPNKAVDWQQPASQTATQTQAPATAGTAESPPPPPTAIDESTRAVQRKPAESWLLRLPDGATVPIVGSTLVGREPSNEQDQAHSLVRLTDPGPSVSKTHALLQIEGRQLLVTDLGSTNGTVVVDARDNETQCIPNVPVTVPVGGSIDFGVYSVYPIRGETQ